MESCVGICQEDALAEYRILLENDKGVDWVTLDNILATEKGSLTHEQLENYFDTQGLGSVKKIDLDKIINAHGIDVFQFVVFDKAYTVIAADDTNRTMEKWTRRIGYLTWAIFIMTAITTIIAIVKYVDC